MSDIVSRLRAGDIITMRADVRLKNEAASEIERLNAALLAIASAPERARLADHDLVDWMSGHARAAIMREPGRG